MIPIVVSSSIGPTFPLIGIQLHVVAQTTPIAATIAALASSATARALAKGRATAGRSNVGTPYELSGRWRPISGSTAKAPAPSRHAIDSPRVESVNMRGLRGGVPRASAVRPPHLVSRSESN